MAAFTKVTQWLLVYRTLCCCLPFCATWHKSVPVCWFPSTDISPIQITPSQRSCCYSWKVCRRISPSSNFFSSLFWLLVSLFQCVSGLLSGLDCSELSTRQARAVSNVSTISQKQHQSSVCTSSGDIAFVCAVACRGLNLEATVVTVLLPFSFWTVCPRGMRLAVISCISSFKTLTDLSSIFFTLIDVLFFALLLLWSPLFCFVF